MERGKVAFGIEALHVDESAAYGVSAEQSAAHREAIRSSVSACGLPEGVPCRVLPLEDVLCGSQGQADSSAAEQASRAQQLQELCQAVTDITGREDLIAHLRGRLLASTAARLGYNKLALGTSANTLATRIIGEVCKGRGFALPSDIQLVDARDGPVVVQPLREVSSKECGFMCRYKGVPLVALPHVPQHPKRSINQLALHFIEGLQSQLPSTIFTVLKSAGNLSAFPWNDPAAAAASDPGQPAAPSTAATRPAAGKAMLCNLCRAPLTEAERIDAVRALMSQQASTLDDEAADDDGDDELAGGLGSRSCSVWQFCQSCRGQVFGLRGGRPEQQQQGPAGGAAGGALLQQLLPALL